jgi:hypothetical protein
VIDDMIISLYFVLIPKFDSLEGFETLKEKY